MSSAPEQSPPRPSGAPVPSRGRPVSRLRRVWRQLLSPFWVVPAAWCLAAVLLGIGLPLVDQGVGTIPLAFESGPEGARSVLSTIAGAMISVTGLVFSITIVVLQLASSQFTPRVLQTFLDDRVTQHTLGVFAASFLYALTVLRGVQNQDLGGPDAVPQLAVTFAYLLVLGAVGMFLTFIHHITTSISVDAVIGRVAGQCRGLIERSEAEAGELPHERPELPRLGRQSVVASPRSGYVDLVDRHRLAEIACGHDVRVEVLHPLGTFVAAGSPLALVQSAADASDVDWATALHAGLSVRNQRSMEQDLSFGLRRLVDIAERALSPGVNDPTTAVQVVNQLHDLLRLISATPDPLPVSSDEEGVPRVVTDEWTFGRYLDLAVDEIAHWGSDSLQIPVRLDAMLVDLAANGPPHRRPVLEAKRAALT